MGELVTHQRFDMCALTKLHTPFLPPTCKYSLLGQNHHHRYNTPSARLAPRSQLTAAHKTCVPDRHAMFPAQNYTADMAEVPPAPASEAAGPSGSALESQSGSRHLHIHLPMGAPVTQELLQALAAVDQPPVVKWQQGLCLPHSSVAPSSAIGAQWDACRCAGAAHAWGCMHPACAACTLCSSSGTFLMHKTVNMTLSIIVRAKLQISTCT